jgi:hypothetical protein
MTATPDHGERVHSETGMSSFERIIICPASVALARGLPDKTSFAAQAGTDKHELVDRCIDAGTTLPVEDDSAAEVNSCLDYIRALPVDSAWNEIQIDLSRINPGTFGYLDFAGINYAARVAHIVDFKFGRRKVHAEKNSQLMGYALGFGFELEGIAEIDTYVLHIVQPSIGHTDEWTISAADLQAWVDAELLPALEQSKVDGLEATPHPDACRYCRARGQCRARAMSVAGDVFSNLTDARLLSIEERAEWANRAEGVSSFFDDVLASVQADLEMGNAVPGWKLVEANTKRKWTDEKAAGVAIRDKLVADGVTADDAESKVFRVSLCTLGVAEKLVGTDFVSGLTEKPKGAPALAKTSDKRPAIQVPTEATKGNSK